MALSDFSKRRLLFETDSIKQHVLARSMFNEKYVVWAIYKCTLTTTEFKDYCLAMVKVLKNDFKYEVHKLDAKVDSMLVLRIKF